MAYTRTVHTLDAGFTPSDALERVGEALATIGVMSTATGWYDSFTDTQGSEVRIVEHVYTGAAGTYDRVYHAFFTKAAFDGLWYTVYYNWDVSTHESGGAGYYDHIYTYEHPDDHNPNSWSNVYVHLSQLTNASAVELITYQSGTDASIFRISSAGESRPFYFVDPAAVPTTALDYSDYGPSGMSSIFTNGPNYYNAPLAATERSITGRGISSDSAQFYSMDEGEGSHYDGGYLDAYTYGIQSYTMGITGSATPGRSSGRERSPYYLIARDIPGCPGYDASMGPNCAMISGYNDASFIPSPSDMITFDGEEYEVLIIGSQSSLSYGFDWVGILARLV